MDTTIKERIDIVTEGQRTFFRSGATLNLDFRKSMLKKLLAAMEEWEPRIADALWADLHKSYEEAYLTEISIVKAEIRTHLKHLSSWARKRKATTPIKLFPSVSHIVKEPLGCALIVSPWNYPVQLLLNPLVGAISSGCTAVLKPSPYVPNVSGVIAEMIAATFDEKYISVIQGHRDVNTMLFEKRWDMIFFTGSPSLGKDVMGAAAKYLTPVVLELGGKSPCIIDKSADISITAKRIAWGKTLNCGQTCIAPDYILIHKDIKEAFVKAFEKEVHKLHGSDIQADTHYVRIVNDKAFERVSGYLKDGHIISGGKTDAATRYIEPTLMDEVPLDSPLMTEEIFGPIFPIITIDEKGNLCSKCHKSHSESKDGSFIETVVEFVNNREKPLALYYFGKEKDGWEVIRRTSSGGGCINDVIMHIANENIPFGGVGNSGMGRYHAKESFEAFSHTRSIVSTGTWIDLPFRYMPYKMFELVKKIL